MLVLTTTANFAYFSGVKLETYERFKAVVKCGEYVAYVVPALDAERVRGDVYIYRDGEDPAEALRKAAAICGRVEEVYVDGGTTLAHFEVIKRAIGAASYRIADDIVKALRAVKRDDEIEKIREAARRIREVIADLELRDGVTETEAAFDIVKALAERELEPGPVLVQFGENTALPHQGPTKKKLRRGDAVVIDVSAAYSGYYGDLTTSYFHGEEPPQYREIYEIVAEAQKAALKAARPGVKAWEVDAAARGVISRRGYGQYFIHRTGHGLGLEIHEPPDISPNSQEELKAGMVFTVEPGVYIPGRFGVRLEVDVSLREDGAEVL